MADKSTADTSGNRTQRKIRENKVSHLWRKLR